MKLKEILYAVIVLVAGVIALWILTTSLDEAKEEDISEKISDSSAGTVMSGDTRERDL